MNVTRKGAGRGQFSDPAHRPDYRRYHRPDCVMAEPTIPSFAASKGLT
jgi:hypothetical protein